MLFSQVHSTRSPGGHESIIHRAIPLFDKIIIALGENSEKKSYFALDQRLLWLREIFMNEPTVEIQTYSGLTVDFCRTVNANFILRGLRTSADFEFERTIGQMNKAMDPSVETVFFLASPEYASLSSSVVREIIKNKGDVSKFIPEKMKL